jgi:hypothetical protein
MARAQQPPTPVFGLLLVFAREAGKIFTAPISAYMHALGYTEGKNIAFDFRFADGNPQHAGACGSARCNETGRDCHIR